MTQIVNVSGYKFVSIYDTLALRVHLAECLGALGLKGSVVLSPEGINVMLAGSRRGINGFYALLKQYQRFADMRFKESLSEAQPFQKLYIKCKTHIVPAAQSVDPIKETGPYVSPKQLKQWLDDGKDLVLLDTRNDYEIEYGTFDGAVSFNMRHFKEFADKAVQADTLKDKTIVMFCTGGIRCEKASPLALNAGFEEVYQLDGGILKYFEECGSDHYAGNCFVFDERVALKPDLTAVEA